MYWNERSNHSDPKVDAHTLSSWQNYASQLSGQAHEILQSGYTGTDAEEIRNAADKLAALSATSDLSAIRTGYYALKKWVDAQSKPTPAPAPAPVQTEVRIGGFGSLLSNAGRRR